MISVFHSKTRVFLFIGKCIFPLKRRISLVFLLCSSCVHPVQGSLPAFALPPLFPPLLFGRYTDGIICALGSLDSPFQPFLVGKYSRQSISFYLKNLQNNHSVRQRKKPSGQNPKDLSLYSPALSLPLFCPSTALLLPLLEC